METANTMSSVVDKEGVTKEGVTKDDLLQAQKRYGEEREKRLRDDADDQFIDISLDHKLQSFAEDSWVNPDAIKDARKMFPENRCQLLIFGAGRGGLLYAVRMIQAGMHPDDIRIVDVAGGFGGT